MEPIVSISSLSPLRLELTVYVTLFIMSLPPLLADGNREGGEEVVP